MAQQNHRPQHTKPHPHPPPPRRARPHRPRQPGPEVKSQPQGEHTRIRHRQRQRVQPEEPAPGEQRRPPQEHQAQQGQRGRSRMHAQRPHVPPHPADEQPERGHRTDPQHDEDGEPRHPGDTPEHQHPRRVVGTRGVRVDERVAGVDQVVPQTLHGRRVHTEVPGPRQSDDNQQEQHDHQHGADLRNDRRSPQRAPHRAHASTVIPVLPQIRERPGLSQSEAPWPTYDLRTAHRSRTATSAAAATSSSSAWPPTGWPDRTPPTPGSPPASYAPVPESPRSSAPTT